MPLPVTIIGGYLGAGKTSLVNHLLRNAGGLRLAVLVNEFGTLPIDEDLIEADDGQMISIAGGCVCCAYGDNMARALRELLSLDPVPDHVVLEASGVALPGAIAGTVGLLPGFGVDGILVLADAETVEASARDPYMGDTITRQLRDADLVVLNKTDLVDDTAEVTAFIARHASGAEVVETTNGQLPSAAALQSFPHTGGTNTEHDTRAFRSISVTIDHAVDPQALARVLSSEELALVRAKGFVAGTDGHRFAIQCVGRRMNIVQAPDDAPLGIVCIGLAPRFDEDAIRAAIAGV